MPFIYVFSGTPGSGKTTLSTKFSSEYNINLYQYDELNRQKSVKLGPPRPRLHSLIKESLKNNQDVIVDDLYETKESRIKLISELSDIECEKILVVIQAPLEVCIERDKNRKSHNLGERTIRQYYNRYQPPSLDEGWDDIIFIQNY